MFLERFNSEEAAKLFEEALAIRKDHPGALLGLALVALAPRLLVYLLSFLTLGIFWVGHQTQLNFLARTMPRTLAAMLAGSCASEALEK